MARCSNLHYTDACGYVDAESILWEPYAILLSMYVCISYGVYPALLEYTQSITEGQSSVGWQRDFCLLQISSY